MYDILKTNNDLPEQFAMFVFMLSAKGDPHFKFGIENIEFPFCFDIKTDPGSIIRILQIPKGNMYPKGLIYVLISISKRLYWKLLRKIKLTLDYSTVHDCFVHFLFT